MLFKNSSQQDLDVSEQCLTNIANLIPAIIIGLDRDCAVFYLNKAAERFVGHTASEVIGQPIQQVVAGLTPHLDLIKFALETKEFKTFNKIKVMFNNAEHFLNIVAYPFANIGVALYIDDITEQVFIENALVQTEKVITLGTLAAGMAHEINNPLGGILQSVQNINRRLDLNEPNNIKIAKEQGVSLEQVHKYLEARGILQFLAGIRELGEHATVVIKNVLRFSRRTDNELVDVDISSVIKDAIYIASIAYNIKERLQSNSLIIQTEFAANIPKLFCVPAEVEQVLINLIDNAAHALIEKEFVPTSTPTIIIRTKSVADKIRIEVADNGPGIPEQLREHLFKPFFTTKPIGIGTGLGLSIVHYIVVDKHHGTIDIESVVGKGATVIIEFPYGSSQKLK